MGALPPRRRRLVAVILSVAAAWIALPAAPAGASAALSPGVSNDQVADLQQALAALSLYRGPVDGRYGPMTAQAVMAFHKHLGLERSFEWQPDDWRHLVHFRLPDPLPEDQVVVDLDRQVLYLHQGGEVFVVPVSSASGEPYRGRGGRWVRSLTPEGEFSITRHVDGLRISYLGALWRPWYFRGGYAIHGSSSVPGHPASHGCIRVPNWEADWLESRLRIGMKVTVGRGGVPEPPTLGPPPEPPARADAGAGMLRIGSRLVA